MKLIKASLDGINVPMTLKWHLGVADFQAKDPSSTAFYNLYLERIKNFKTQ